MMDLDVKRVDKLVRQVGDDVLMRHWRALPVGSVREKSPGDLVTDIDEAAELQLSTGLLALLPHSVVLGEEAATASPDLLQLLQQDAPVWIIDPIDGTGNYVAGSPHFAVMVALVVAGVARVSWIYQPVTRKMYHARSGAGAFCDGRPLATVSDTTPLSYLKVGISTKFTPEPLRSHVVAQLHHFEDTTPYMCAGFEYAALADGSKAMAMFNRLLPWDHVPGLLLAQEAGLFLRHFDSSAYDLRQDRTGLIVARDEGLWLACRDLLVPASLRA